MTTEQIDAVLARESIKYEAAKAIREVLDKARAKFGAEAWDDNSVQDDVLNLVTEEVDE